MPFASIFDTLGCRAPHSNAGRLTSAVLLSTRPLLFFNNIIIHTVLYGSIALAFRDLKLVRVLVFIIDLLTEGIYMPMA